MTIQTSTGITVRIVAAAPATFDEEGFSSLTYVNIAELTSVGVYGSTQEQIEHSPLVGDKEKHKGQNDNGSLDLEYGIDTSDEGQQLLSAGSGGAANSTQHSVEVRYSDGAIDYAYGYVFGSNKNPGSINSIVSGSSSIGINKLVEVSHPSSAPLP